MVKTFAKHYTTCADNGWHRKVRRVMKATGSWFRPYLVTHRCCLARPRLGAALLVLTSTIASGCVLFTGDFSPLWRGPQPLQERVVSGEGDAKLLIIDLSGLITSEKRSAALGLRMRESTVARVEAELRRADEDDEIKALILRINSPGGSVTASDIIFEQLMRFKDKHQMPVVAELMDVATSGAYYTALAADEIIAHPTTVTGSIGVVFSSVSAAGLLEKIGVRNQTITTGKMKDIGSPLRTMTPEERQLLENLLGGMQTRFVGLVRKRRPGLTPEMEKVMTDGRIFSAEQALAGGLIDRIGYLEDAIELIKQRAGLEEAVVIMYRRPDEFASSVYSRTGGGGVQLNVVNLDLEPLSSTPQFLYLWMP